MIMVLLLNWLVICASAVGADEGDAQQKLNQLNEFYSFTKVPILINTSFNIRGEPIVCTPKDAFKCFMGTNLDALVINGYVLEKNKQNKVLKLDYKKEFKLD